MGQPDPLSSRRRSEYESHFDHRRCHPDRPWSATFAQYALGHVKRLLGSIIVGVASGSSFGPIQTNRNSIKCAPTCGELLLKSAPHIRASGEPNSQRALGHGGAQPGGSLSKQGKTRSAAEIWQSHPMVSRRRLTTIRDHERLSVHSTVIRQHSPSSSVRTTGHQ